jgi:hypothetical protein
MRELGGSNELVNVGPALEACAYVKNQADHCRAVQAKRQRIRPIGVETVKPGLALQPSEPVEADARFPTAAFAYCAPPASVQVVMKLQQGSGRTFIAIRCSVLTLKGPVRTLCS